jgi:uncharacterized membrane protein (DUF2068 family)
LNVNQTINPKGAMPAANEPVQTLLPLKHKAPIGLRTVALFELGKGVLALLGGLYLLSLIHKDVEAEATNLLHFLRADPAWHISRWFLETAGHLTDQRLRLFALVAAVYCVVRIVETYGLWHELHWAEWFAAISAGLYLPVEIYHVVLHIHVVNVTFFLANIALVIYLCRILAANHQRAMALKNHPPQAEPAKS